MTVKKFVFYQTRDAAQAARWVEADLAERKDEFYDDAVADAAGTVRVKDVPHSVLSRARKDAERAKEAVKKNIEIYERYGKLRLLGAVYIKYGKILLEELCDGMPYFNLDFWDWTVPEDTDDENPWFAVPVVFHG